MFDDLNLVQQLAVFVLPLIFAITAHEAAHGWVAYRLGDPTAKLQGRITLNPIPHIDPVGTIILPLGLYALSSAMGGGGIIFGWAKPVPIDPRNFKHYRRDTAWVAIAGPASNLIQLIFWALMLRFAVSIETQALWLAEPLVYMSLGGILINALLMALNLLPILPLDGGRVLASVLPPRLAFSYAKTEPYGFFILLFLLFSNLLWLFLAPLLQLSQGLAYYIAGI